MPPPSPRQLAALGACLDAGSVKEAAFVLGISYGAMRVKLHRIYRQLGVTNMAQAVEKLDLKQPGWHM